MADVNQFDDARRTPLLVLEGVRYGFKNRPQFLGPVEMEVCAGDCWAIVGPNGAGKSSLMRLMAGLVLPNGGTVIHRPPEVCASAPASVPGNSANQMKPIPLSSRDRARLVAYVPQHVVVTGRLTVQEVVMLGRYPQRDVGYFETDRDRQAVARAMAMADVAGLADRDINTLSGGEAQRVHMAAALAQEPQLLLLDEPTASLDLEHQLAAFELLRNLAVRSRLGAVLATHDLNLAARFCTHALVLHNGRVAAQGRPDSVLRPDILEPVYGVRMLALSVEDSRKVYLTGECKSRSWLAAIERLGGTRE